MIAGIGTDLVEISRVISACHKSTFIQKMFTCEEQKLIEQDRKKAASNFAVKEAVSKMFGTGFRSITPLEIEVLRDELGKPYVNLYGKTKELARQKKIDMIFVSLSNTKEHVIAFVVGESR